MEKEGKAVSPGNPTPPGPPDRAMLESIAAALSSARRPALVTGAALEAAGGWQAGIQVAESLGLEVYTAPNAAQTGFPTAHPNFRAYLPNNALALRKALEVHDVVLVVGAPVFVMYPYMEGPYLSPATRFILLTDDPQEASRMETGEAHLGNLRGALEGLLGVAKPSQRALSPQSSSQEPEGGESDGISLLAALHAISRHYTPETLLVDETISSGGMTRRVLRTHKARSYIRAASGGLGYGMPAAVGAQLARADAPVLALVGDGSAMYAPQALWTAVRQQLPIKVVILNNGGYSILKNFNQNFFDHLGVAPGLDLPGLDLSALARSMGISATSVSARNSLEESLEIAFSSEIARLIDIHLNGASQ